MGIVASGVKLADGGKNFGRYLRSNMTKPEILLWKRLQKEQLGYAISRQYRVGPYYVDFYCRKYRVAIEIDGKIHELKKGKDEVRDLYLINSGISVYRFSAQAVLRDPDFIAQQIKIALSSHAGLSDDQE